MGYNGKQTTVAGTLVQQQVITSIQSAEYNIANILLVSNDQPLQTLEGDLYGWFKNLDQIGEYFGVNTKTYKMCKHLLMQKNFKNPALNNVSILIKVVNYVDATCASITTKGLEDRLSNFAPALGERVFVGKTTFTSGKNAQSTGRIELYKTPTIEELCIALNRMSGEAYFEVVEVDGQKELKISTLFAGTQGNLSFSQVNQQLLARGAVDIGGADYLNVIPVKGDEENERFVYVAGEDFINAEEDNTSYFAKIINQLSRDLGYNPRTILSSVVFTASDLININNELALLQQNSDKNWNCTFITGTSGASENKELTDSFQTQPLFIMNNNGNYDKLSTLCLAAARCAPFVSQNAQEMTRYDPEWDNIELDDDVYYNQKGYDNAEINALVADGYAIGVQYNGEGLGLITRANDKAWSTAMYSCYAQVMNGIPVYIANLVRGFKSKAKNTNNISLVVAALKKYGQKLYDNGYLTNTPKDDDPLFESLTDGQKQDILRCGWSANIPNPSQIKDNQIPYEIVMFIGGIMARFKGVSKIGSN